MPDPAERSATLVRHFERIERRHMQGLPILNPRLAVEAVGMRDFNEHRVLVLITPWFMNMVLLPESDAWAESDQGSACDIEFPGEPLEFNVCHDTELGTYLTAALFRTMSDFPDQDTARAVAMEVVTKLFTAPAAADQRAGARKRNTLSRRSLLSGFGSR
jgi:[NiFe] hydrogenase assembly HybE family chaperone